MALVTTVLFFCSLLWLGFDIARKTLSHRLPAIPLTVILMYGQIPFYCAFLFFLDFKFNFEEYWLPALVASTVNVGGNLFFILSIRSAPFGVSVPILSFTPVFAALVSLVVLDEKLSSFQILGMLLVVFGSVLLMFKSGEHKDYSSRQIKKGIALMVFVSLLWAIVPVFDKICLRHSNEGIHALLQCLFIGIVLHAYLFSKGRALKILGGLKGSWKVYITGLFCAITALLLQFWAIQVMEVSVVEVVKRSIELGGALVCGFLFFQEKIEKEKILSILLLGVGVALVLLF